MIIIKGYSGDESDMREMGKRIIRAALLQYSRKGKIAWGEL